jgi:hypothetical protein
MVKIWLRQPGKIALSRFETLPSIPILRVLLPESVSDRGKRTLTLCQSVSCEAVRLRSRVASLEASLAKQRPRSQTPSPTQGA